jgi:hypothetical protein
LQNFPFFVANIAVFSGKTAQNAILAVGTEFAVYIRNLRERL